MNISFTTFSNNVFCTLFSSHISSSSCKTIHLWKITSGRAIGEKMKLFTYSESHTHQNQQKSTLSQERFSRNNFPREIFAKITTQHSSVPIPCCCLSCSYESILRKKVKRGICWDWTLFIISYHHWLYLSILDKKTIYITLLLNSLNAKLSQHHHLCSRIHMIILAISGRKSNLSWWLRVLAVKF